MPLLPTREVPSIESQQRCGFQGRKIAGGSDEQRAHSPHDFSTASQVGLRARFVVPPSMVRTASPLTVMSPFWDSRDSRRHWSPTTDRRPDRHELPSLTTVPPDDCLVQSVDATIVLPLDLWQSAFGPATRFRGRVPLSRGSSGLHQGMRLRRTAAVGEVQQTLHLVNDLVGEGGTSFHAVEATLRQRNADDRISESSRPRQRCQCPGAANGSSMQFQLTAVSCQRIVECDSIIHPERSTSNTDRLCGEQSTFTVCVPASTTMASSAEAALIIAVSTAVGKLSVCQLSRSFHNRFPAPPSQMTES